MTIATLQWMSMCFLIMGGSTRWVRTSANGTPKDFVRLFGIPGMNHCSGGPAADNVPSAPPASSPGGNLPITRPTLHRWREGFAERLREWGIDAEATRRVSRGVTRSYEPLWRIKAREGRRLRSDRPLGVDGPIRGKRLEAIHAWAQIGRALALSGDAEDLRLARSLSAFVHAMPGVPDRGRERVRVDSRTPAKPDRDIDAGHLR